MNILKERRKHGVGCSRCGSLDYLMEPPIEHETTKPGFTCNQCGYYWQYGRDGGIMKYRKKPVVIDAVQWEGTATSWKAIMAMGDVPWKPGEMGTETFIIETWEGNLLVRKGDFIIRGVAGEFYPCKPGIFQKTYECAESPRWKNSHD